jgi:hypothetical protein
MSLPSRFPNGGAIQATKGRDLTNVPRRRISRRPGGEEELEAWIPVFSPHGEPAEPIALIEERSTVRPPLVLTPPRREAPPEDKAPLRVSRVHLRRPRRTAVIWSRNAILALMSSRSLLDLRAARIIAAAMLISAFLLAATALYAVAQWRRSPPRPDPDLAPIVGAVTDPSAIASRARPGAP